MASQKQQYTILYGRLSQEDERAGESNSILHQRELLESYAQAKGFENTLFLADDGYSGTNFERPSWKKIVEMIETGEVSTLIVKDASRLGREYLQVGYYMEIGDCTFSTILDIRRKLRKHKKLEKWEREYYDENRELIDFKSAHLTDDEDEFIRQLMTGGVRDG